MKIFPAIDLYGGNAVRLLHGDYDKMTVYSHTPLTVAETFAREGAQQIHLVDLEGARLGKSTHHALISQIVRKTNLFAEIGGGIRTMESLDAYIEAGASRVILGTAALTDRDFLLRALDRHGEKVAVGVDARNGFVAIKGWTEQSETRAIDFCIDLEKIGVSCVIVTDISKDGAMMGASHELYEELASKLSHMKVIASGGVSSLEDVSRLTRTGVHGAIIGKAWYTGAIALPDAIKLAANGGAR